MDGQSTAKFTWVIENFTELEAEQYSPEFIVGCCKWRLIAYPKGDNMDHHLSLFLDVPSCKSLPFQWRRRARVKLFVVNQFSNSQTLSETFDDWFNATESSWGYPSFIPLNKLKNPLKGFLVDNKVIVEAEVELVEVEGDLDILENPTLTLEKDHVEESPLVPTMMDTEKVELEEEVARVENQQEPLEAYEMIETDEAKSDDAAPTAGASKSSPTNIEMMVQTNGFLVHDTQVEQVKTILEKHPDLTSNFQIKNQQLRTAFMNVLLDLIEAFRRSPQDITEDDLSKGRNTLIDLKNVGLNICWLKAKFEEVSKKKERADGSRVEEFESQIEKLKMMVSDLEAALEKEKEEVAAMRIPLSFNDFIS